MRSQVLPGVVMSCALCADFRLGLNAAQTTLGAIARLSGASLTASPSH